MKKKRAQKKKKEQKKSFDITRIFQAAEKRKDSAVPEAVAAPVDESKKKRKKKDSTLDKIQLRKSRELLMENLGLLIDSGFNFTLALSSLQRSTKSKAMKRKLDEMIESIEVGEPLWKAMEKVELLPPHILAIIRSGEESGRLPEILKLVTSQMERAREFKTKLRSAMIYPSMVIFIALVILIISFTFTIPNMAKAFSDVTFELPLPTRILIVVGGFLGKYGAIFIPGVLAFIILMVYLGFVNKKTRKYGQAVIVKIPLIRSLIQQIELSRMGFVMNNMLNSGFSVYDSFGWLKQAASFESYRSAYTEIQKEIGVGNNFENSFKKVKHLDKIIPDEFQQFIFAAEMTGNLTHAFDKMGTSFDAKIDVTTKNITVAIEPVMLVGLGIFVFFVAIAVFMPIYNLIGAI